MVVILLTLILVLLETTTNVTETVALIQAADGYSDLDFTVSEDAGTEDVILTFKSNGDQNLATATLSQSLSSFTTFHSRFGVIIG